MVLTPSLLVLPGNAPEIVGSPWLPEPAPDPPPEES